MAFVEAPTAPPCRARTHDERESAVAATMGVSPSITSFFFRLSAVLLGIYLRLEIVLLTCWTGSTLITKWFPKKSRVILIGLGFTNP